MIVCGIDPGSVHVGYCVLEIRGPRPKFLAAGECDMQSASHDIGKLGPFGLTVVEKPSGRVIEGRNGQHLIEAAWNGGELYRAFRSVGHAITLSHSQWVTSLLGGFGRGKQDPMVKRAIEMMVVDWPKRSNNHMRDAAGVAIVGARMAGRLERKVGNG